MNLKTLIQKLNLEEEWHYLQKNPSSLFLENFLQKILDDLEKQGSILLYPDSKHLVYHDEQCDRVLTQIFKAVSPLYGLESKSSIVRGFCFEYSLSLEKKVERAAKAWGWKSLDEILARLAHPSKVATDNLNLTLASLDNFLLEESLTRCLLSESRFVRERRLFLENKLKKEEVKSS